MGAGGGEYLFCYSGPGKKFLICFVECALGRAWIRERARVGTERYIFISGARSVCAPRR